MITNSDARIRLLMNLGKLKAAQDMIYNAVIWLPDIKDAEASKVFEEFRQASFKLGCSIALYERLCRSPDIEEDKLLT